jgi:uncharacterized protein
MQSKQAIDFILTKLGAELREDLCYHSLAHTLSVIDNVKAICKVESVSDYQLAILMTAAAYHDCGFLRSYNEHEIHGCHLARETLPSYGYSTSDIRKIEQMIMATRIPQNPINQLSIILCDADLLYLGGDNYERISNSLYVEMKHNGSAITEEKWLEVQISFLEKHSFRTEFAIKSCRATKEERLNMLRKRRNEC